MNNDKVIEEMLARNSSIRRKSCCTNTGEDKKEAGDGENNVCQDTTNVSLNKNGFKFCA